MNERLVIRNTLAGYARSLLSAALGLFVVRWTLDLLGASDMGLYGVVGGVVFLFGFLTPVFQGVAARFYAFEIGKADYTEATGRMWFNSIQFFVVLTSFILLAVTYFVGLYALNGWLSVPEGRLCAAVWAFRSLLTSVFVAMIAVPYVAMLIANQAIMSVSGVQLGQAISVFLSVAGLCVFKDNVMSDMDRFDGLIAYSIILSCISICGSVILILLAKRRYAACMTDISLWISKDRFSRIVGFWGWQLLGGAVWTIRGQFMTFFINKCFGTSFNASYTIASQVSNQAGALASSLNDAVSPALASEAGGGNYERVMGLARKGSLLALALVFLFAVPLALLIDPILEFWLKIPPPGCAELCISMLLVAAVRQGAAGYGLAVMAHGRLARWQICDAVLMLLAIPLAILLWRMGYGVASIGWSLVISEIATSLNRYFFARHLLLKNDKR